MTTDPLTESDAWQRGEEAARQQTADITVAKPEVPVSSTTAATSILASPHIGDWPTECQQWLLDKCHTALDPPPASTSNLDPAKHWTDWAAAVKAAVEETP